MIYDFNEEEINEEEKNFCFCSYHMMNNAHRRNETNLEKPFPGCLGRTVNLFDLNAGIHSKKLLTDRPRYDDSLLSRSESDVGMGTSPPAHRHEMEDNLRTWNIKEIGMPVKIPVEKCMPKEAEYKDNPPNVVAKLMGLDMLPSHQPYSVIPKIRARECSPCKIEDLALTRRKIKKEYGFSEKRLQGQMTQIHHRSVQKECKDLHENWQLSLESDCVRKKSLQIDSNKGAVNDKKMSLVRQKFMEAKRLSTDEKLRQSKEFQDALEVLSSNRDVFVRFLQEPNSLFSKNLYEFHSLPSSPGTKRITILRPSNVENFKGSSRKSDKTLKKPAQVEQSSSTIMRNQRDDEFTVQPTRIVVLKPSPLKTQDIKKVVSPPSSSPGIVHGESFNKEPENDEAELSRRLAREITQKMRANIMGNQVNNEIFVSSVFSNVCSGSDSSFHKSENVQAFENLSDSEFMSPSSRHSWDYVKRCGGPFSSSSFSRASCSPEWSVSKEAKKRLSERWEMMASHGNAQEQRGVRRNSHTLGDMLALSETKKSVNSEDEDKKPAQIESVLSLTRDGKQGYVGNSPINLTRSKSAPESSTMVGEESSDAGMSKMEEKETDSKSSFKGKVSQLIFSRNKRPSKKANKDEMLSVPHPESRIYDHRTNIRNNNGLEGCLSVGLSSNIPLESTKMRHQRGITCHEKGSAILSMSQDQPRSILVLEPHFDKNDSSIIQESFGYVRPGFQQQVKSIIDKSPPIESIARTLQHDDYCSCASDKSPFQTSSVPTRAEEERNFLLFIRTLLTMAGLESDSFPLRWHSLENPLDPSLRDKYANLDSKEPLYEAKRKELKSYRMLIYDCVTAALLDFMDNGSNWNRKSISNYRSHNMSLEFALPTSIDRVLAKMKEWFDNEARSFANEDEGDSGSLVLERVVRKKVVGKEWVENLKNEGENIGREIEVNLLEELVEEAVSDFAEKT